MRFSTIAVLACLMLALAACSPAQNPVSPTLAVAATDTIVPATPTATEIQATNSPSGPLGSISGAIVPPGDPQPATSLNIYAREKNGGTIYTLDIPIDQTSYKISNLPAGVYNVFAWFYEKGLDGAYTSAKITLATTSSDQLTCTNSLVDITLAPGKMDFNDADIACWGGNFFSYFQQP
jgi:hypothetical protein